MRYIGIVILFLITALDGIAAEKLVHTPAGDFTQEQIDKIMASDAFDDPKCKGDDPNRYDLKKPMVFFHDKAEACQGNAVGYPTRAVGIITKDTPQALEDYIAQNGSPYTLELTSSGGDLLAAMRLGDLIRKHNLNTSLGEVCASACAYAFLGGVKRYAVTDTSEIPDYFAPGNDDRFIGPSGDKLGVHQFYEKETVSNLDAPAFTGSQRLEDQATMAQVVDYTIRMGVNPEMVITASQVPPNQIRWLTVAERVGMNIDNTAVHYTPLGLYPFGKAGSYAGVTNNRQGEDNSIRIYCVGKSKSLHLSLIFGQANPWKNDAIWILKTLQASITTKNGQERIYPMTVVDSGEFEENGQKKLAVAVTITDFPNNDVENITDIGFSDVSQTLGRAQWSFLGIVQFRLRGDPRYLRLAMRNCIQ